MPFSPKLVDRWPRTGDAATQGNCDIEVLSFPIRIEPKLADNTCGVTLNLTFLLSPGTAVLFIERPVRLLVACNKPISLVAFVNKELDSGAKGTKVRRGDRRCSADPTDWIRMDANAGELGNLGGV